MPILDERDAGGGIVFQGRIDQEATIAGDLPSNGTPESLPLSAFYTTRPRSGLSVVVVSSVRRLAVVPDLRD
jgi:hypothetical protein